MEIGASSLPRSEVYDDLGGIDRISQCRQLAEVLAGIAQSRRRDSDPSWQWRQRAHYANLS